MKTIVTRGFCTAAKVIPQIARSYQEGKLWVIEFAQALSEDHIRCIREIGKSLRNLRGGITFSLCFLTESAPGNLRRKPVTKVAIDRSISARLTLKEIAERVVAVLRIYIPETVPVRAT